MIIQKERTMKLSKYFELRNPVYETIRIIPHKSCRSYNSNNVAKAIAYTYKSINKRIYKEQKKIIFETAFKILYAIDIKNGNANFYFIVPSFCLNTILEKVKEIWNKATVEIIEGGLSPFSKEAEAYTLSYKKQDALSIDCNKKSNEPLNSLLNVMEIMKDDDRVTILYNFIPVSQAGWLDQYSDTMKSIREKKSVDKKIFSFDYIFRNGVVSIISILDGLMNVINDFVGCSKTEEGIGGLYASLINVIEERGELSIATKKKKEATILAVQVAVVSDSIDATRRNNNGLSICQSYRTLDSDNELIYKKVKKVPLIENVEYEMMDKNVMSSDEVGNFIQIPGRTLLQQFKINHIKTEEHSVPNELQQGYLCLGEATLKGNKTKAYIENEYNTGNLPLVLIGSQGSGKSEYIKNIARNCIKNNEGIIVLDFIKSCNLSESIASITPKDKLIKLNLANECDIQGFGYNEMNIEPSMSAFKKLDMASKQTSQVMNLVDAISVGDPLTSRMRRYLSSASKVVFCQGYNSLKDVINCLEDHNKRSMYINSLSQDLKVFLEDELNTLKELNEWSKGSKATKDRDEVSPEIVGTNSAKIEHILDRVSMLREDFKLKYMYDKKCDDNIDLVDCMEKGKVVLLQMREDDFPTKMIKNILVTYWVSKVWLTSQIRGAISEQPLRTNFIVDEIFQAPTSLSMMNYIIPQSRKFGLHNIISTQYLKQLDGVFESLEASGSSFMLLKGANENDFNHFKSKFEGVFEFEDLRDMSKFSAMNLINYSRGYSSFITKLPKPI